MDSSGAASLGGVNDLGVYSTCTTDLSGTRPATSSLVPGHKVGLHRLIQNTGADVTQSSSGHMQPVGSTVRRVQGTRKGSRNTKTKPAVEIDDKCVCVHGCVFVPVCLCVCVFTIDDTSLSLCLSSMSKTHRHDDKCVRVCVLCI